MQHNQPAPFWLPEGRGSGAGAERRNAQAANGVKRFLRATQGVLGRVELHVIGPVRNGASIEKAVGFPTVGFVIVLENGTARHTLLRHGDPSTEARRGQLAVTMNDLALVPQLLAEFDTVEPADPTKQGASQARFCKRIGTIDYEVFAEARRAARQVAFKTMLKRRAEEASS